MRTHHRRGFVIVAVLVIVALASMVVAGLMFRMRAELTASAAVDRGEQARDAAMAGIQTAMSVLRSATPTASGYDPAVWYSNPDAFKQKFVYDDGGDKWYFTVYAPVDDNAPAGGASGAAGDQSSGPVRFGLADESGLININYATEQMLLVIPGMTPDLVDALLDYRDSDSTPRPNGAEQDYYDQLASPYTIANGPFTTVDELLKVKGFTASIVFGEDANLNGVLDANEDDGDEQFPPDDRDGTLNRGLRGYLTTFTPSLESRVSGEPAQIALNGDLVGIDKIGLKDDTVRFIRLLKAEGRALSHPSDLLDLEYTARSDHKDLNITKGEALKSGVDGESLATLLRRTTVGAKGTKVAGPVNLNTAPAAVLSALPGLAGQGEQVVSVRGNLDENTRATSAWLYTQGIVDATGFKQVAPYLTTRGGVFRVRSVGYGLPSGRFRVLEAVVKVTAGVPEVVYMRDVTRTGLPMALGDGEGTMTR